MNPGVANRTARSLVPAVALAERVIAPGGNRAERE